jgi:hypothetical protein
MKNPKILPFTAYMSTNIVSHSYGRIQVELANKIRRKIFGPTKQVRHRMGEKHGEKFCNCVIPPKVLRPYTKEG